MKVKRIKGKLYGSGEYDEYTDLVELFELADVNDEDIARDMNVDIQTVKKIKDEWESEEVKDSPSVFFKTNKRPWC